MELVKCCKVPYSELMTSGVLVYLWKGTAICLIYRTLIADDAILPGNHR